MLKWAPLCLFCLLCASAYCVLVYLFFDSVEAETSLISNGFSMDGGPTLLFLMVSWLLGWVAVSLVERATDMEGPLLLWIIVPTCWVTAAVGFGLAWILSPDYTEQSWLLVISGFATSTAIGVRTYLADQY